MKRTIVSFVAVLLALTAYAQSAAEIAAVTSIATQYGYSQEEIQTMMQNKGMEKTSGLATPSVPEQALPGQLDNFGDEKPIEVTPIDTVKSEEPAIFGHRFFVSKGLSLIPSVTAPVPESYILGPGDDITITVWGAAYASIKMTIASDGSITLPQAGPLYISGMTLEKAERMLKSRLASIYGGLSDGRTDIHLTVGRIRGLSVYVLGEVRTPGVYTLPSLCNIPTAIYMAGGVKDMGSVRKISLFRGGKEIAVFDLYDFIFNGSFNADNLKLQDGDIISVAPAQKIVSISGEVKRNTRFEMIADETLSELIKYSGGFTSQARQDVIHVDRTGSPKGMTFDVPSSLFGSFILSDGDIVSVNGGFDRYENKVSIEGNVMHAGDYAITDGMNSVKDLIAAAGGLKEGSVMPRAYIRRLDENLLPVEVSFNLRDVVEGRSEIKLEKDDVVRIYSYAELRDTTVVISVLGHVNKPGDIEFREGMTLGDAVMLAGGCKDGVDLTHVEIATRGGVDKAMVAAYNLTENGFDKASIRLKPFDHVFIRAQENFRPLKTIEVKGEVKFPGYYAVEKNTVRLSDIIQRAGGFTDDAYIKGARLKRKLIENEEEIDEMIREVAERNNYRRDTTAIDSLRKDLKAGDYYSVAIELGEVMKHPGSDQDIILREGDILDIPQMNNTVKISGGVYLPNVVAYNPKFSWRDYVNQAGGLVKGARTNHIYVVFQDGSTAKIGSSKFHMQPGMELVVPQVENKNRNKMSAGEIAAITSAVTSITSIIVMVINQLRR